MKTKIVSMLLVLALTLCLLPASALAAEEVTVVLTGDYSAEGSSVTYTLTSDGVLTISGTGAMKDVSSANATNIPWYNNRADITSVVIESGITAIGKYAFGASSAANGYANLTSVSIPDTVTAIGQYAFRYAGLTEVTIPASVTTMGTYAFAYNASLKKATVNSDVLGNFAFYNCSGLLNVTLNGSLETLGASTFSNCKTLKEIVLPSTVTSVGNTAFSGCSALERIYLPAGLTSIGNGVCNSCTGLSFVFYAGSETAWSNVTLGSNNTVLTSSNLLYNVTGKATTDAPAISTQPVSASVNYKAEAQELSVSATTAEGAQVYYTWYYNTENSTEGGIKYAEDRTCTPDTTSINILGTRYYYCAVMQISNGLVSITVSDTAAVTVKVSDFTGSGTEEDPYVLEDSNDLNTLSSYTAEGQSFEGMHFKLAADIALPVDWVSIGALKPETTAAGNGKNMYPFSGILNGDGHTVTFAYGSKPLFAYVREATVKNLNISGEYIAEDGLVSDYVVDYGADGSNSTGTGGSYQAGVPDTIDIINVTIKSGTVIKGSGFIGGYSAGQNIVNVIDCTVESGVKIGWDAEANAPAENSRIGSFGGDFNGYIKNSSSAAAVYGTDYVGGIVGGKGQTIGPYVITDCTFTGEIIATGKMVGGIAGGGYSGTLWGLGSAGNTPCAVIENCLVTGKVTGATMVGGIFGGEEGSVQCWDNGIGYIRNNLFVGTVTATGTDAIVGGVIGYMNSLNKHNIVENNHFAADCGAAAGIGAAKYIDTSSENHETASGATYVSTADGALTSVNRYFAKASHNRTDDPMGADREKLAKAATAAELNDGTVLALLNSGEGSSQNWAQSKEYPIILSAKQISDAEKAEELIAAIGEVTVYSADAIESARAAYDALSAEQKTLVSNLAILEAAEEALEVAKDENTKTPVKIYVSIANKGSVVVMQQLVTVTDVNDNGLFDVDDALYAAHEAGYEGGAAAGYGAAYTQWGLGISKLWGDTSYAYGYWLNNASCWSLEDVVAEGDHLVAFVYTDGTTWSDAYTKFEQFGYTATAGSALTVKLEKAGYDASWNTVFTAHAGASVTVYDSQGNALTSGYTVTDNGDGTYNVTVNAAGTYYLVAADSDPITVPAVCEITVSQKTVDDDENPKTGDAAALRLMCAMLTISVCSLAVLLPKKRSF